MYTLKGVFPEPKKTNKKNFIKDNVKQLKHMQGKASNEPTLLLKSGRESRVGEVLPSVQSSASNKSGKPTFQVGMSSLGNARAKKQNAEIKFRKGDMAEFLRRKELRQLKNKPKVFEEASPSESESTGRLRDVGCQTLETNLPQKLGDGAKLTVLYPKEDGGSKLRASGDSGRNREPSPSRLHSGQKAGDDNLDEQKRKARAMEKEKDPYLPTGYQKGVLPRYLRERREETKAAENIQDEDCPPGHVTLPDTERKETLRMLRNSFAELVSELNKMPVRTDTLRMRSRKMELEKQLAKLEEGIKVFSRPKVFVRIGE